MGMQCCRFHNSSKNQARAARAPTAIKGPFTPAWQEWPGIHVCIFRCVCIVDYNYIIYIYYNCIILRRYVYMCIYVYICVCMCIYVYVCVYMCIYMYIYVYMCMYVYICVCMCIYDYICVYMGMCMCIYLYIYLSNLIKSNLIQSYLSIKSIKPIQSI